MQQDTYVGGARVEPLSREVLTVEIREGRDLLAAESMAICEPYVTVTVFDSTGRAFGGKKTNVVAGSLNPYWMERFEFHVTQWDKEGGYVEIALHDNRGSQGELLGYIRQPLFRLSDTGAMEGWYFLDRARHPSAALYFRMAIGPYHHLPLTAADTTGLGSGISARQPPAAAGIGISGVGSRSAGPTTTGMPMGALATPGLTTGPVVARDTATSQLYLMRQRFWGLANTYEIKDAQGMLHYRLIGNFGGKLDDIRIADATGHEVGFIREESSFLNRLYRMPTYLISAYGTTAKLKKKFLSINEPIYSLRPFNAPSINAKGNLSNYDFSFYQATTIIADVSKGLAPPGDVGLYGIRVAPTFSNPLLILAAVVAIDRINDVGGMRPVSGVYSDSKSLMSRYKRKSKSKPAVVATSVTTPAGTPVATTATTAPAVPVIAAAPLVSPPLAVSTPRELATTTSSRVYQTEQPTTGYYGSGIPTTPVVSVTTVPTGQTAAREQLRQEELLQQQMMQAERVNYEQMMMQQQEPQGIQQKEKDHKVSEAEIRQSQPVRIPISGEGGFD